MTALSVGSMRISIAFGERAHCPVAVALNLAMTVTSATTVSKLVMLGALATSESRDCFWAHPAHSKLLTKSITA